MPNQRDLLPDDGHMSYSQLSEFAQCPRKYKLHRVDKIPTRPVFALVSGKAVHAGLEMHNLARIQGEGLSAKDIIEVGVGTIEGNPECTEVEGLTREQVKDTFAKSTGPAVASYLRDTEPKIADQSIIGVEQEIRFELGGVPFIGYVDLHTEEAIWDYKLTERKKSEKEVASDPQLILYRTQLRTPRAGLLCLMRNRGDSQLSEQPLTSPMVSGVMDWALSIVRGIQTARTTDVWPRADPRSFYCGRTCPYYYHCFKGE